MHISPFRTQRPSQCFESLLRSIPHFVPARAISYTGLDMRDLVIVA